MKNEREFKNSILKMNYRNKKWKKGKIMESKSDFMTCF